MTAPSLEGLNVVGVVRQSRGDDGTQSIPEQVARLRAECEARGAILLDVYTEEDISGGRSLDRRPGLSRAVRDVEGGRAAVVMVAYFDRLARSLKTQAEVLERVEAKGGKVMALDVGHVSNGTAAQWLSSTMLGMVSEYYRRSVGERLKASKQANIDRGVPPFPRITPAYRRRKDGTLEQDPVKAPVVLEAIRMRLEDGASFADLARFLRGHGIPGTHNTVQRMFQSRLLIGEIHFGDFRPNLNAIEAPLIDRDTFRKLTVTRASAGRKSYDPRLLARLRILRCATCDSPLHVDGGSKRRRYCYYRCRFDGCAQPVSILADDADQVVTAKVIELLADLEGRADAKAELEAARVAAAEDAAALDDAIRTLAGLGDRPATREVLDGLQAKADASQGHYDRLLSVTAPDKTVTTATDWDKLSFEGRRDLIRAVVASAVVAPGRGPGRITVTGRGQ